MVEELEAARHLQQEFARHPSHQPLVQNKASVRLSHGCSCYRDCECTSSAAKPSLPPAVVDHQGVASRLMACCYLM